MVYKVTEETIHGIANAIRAKRNYNDEIKVEDFAEEILNIETGENTVSAARSADAAADSAISAASSAQFAMENASLVAEGVQKAKDWATGEGSVEGDETYNNNAKYYSEVSRTMSENAHIYSNEARESASDAKEYEGNAAASEEAAKKSEMAAKQSENTVKENLDHVVDMVQNLEGFNSEAWAVGTRNGIVVTEGDVAYKNNSKYWADVARTIALDFQSNVGVSNVLADATVIEEVIQ